MEIKAPVNNNYCATVVQITTLVELANCSNVQAAIIFGNHVIVGKDTKVGDIGLFFPVETALDADFLKMNNLYNKAELNVDTTKKGYFEPHGRIKCVKFRGHKSEGFFVPLNFLDYLPIDRRDYNLSAGAEFDALNGKPICHKYIPKYNKQPSLAGPGKKRQPKPQDKIVVGQFQFHIDTANLRKNVHRLTPETIISITDKWHGTSAIFSNVLVKRELTIVEKIARFLGAKIQETKYDIIHASRRVIKGVGEKEKDGIHFYGENLWSTVAKEIKDRIPKGYTIYGEIVGYTPEGKAIQKGYTYKCEPNKHRFLVYRITVTNEDGFVLELDYNQRRDFCKKFGFEPVIHLYYGTVSNLYNWLVGSDYPFDENELLKVLEDRWVNKKCAYNTNVPTEGVVVRIEQFDDCEAFKLKSFEFLQRESKELDSGEIDMETAEAVDEITE